MGVVTGGGGGGSQAVNVATKTLNNAQIKALAHPTPITLLAAPGAGFANVPIHATLRLTWVADYTNIQAAAHLDVTLGGGTILSILDEVMFGVDSLLAQGEDAAAILGPYMNSAASLTRGLSGYLDGDIENQALALVATNDASGDFTGGNSGNSLKVTLLYYTVTF